jgi:hypothetical protein
VKKCGALPHIKLDDSETDGGVWMRVEVAIISSPNTKNLRQLQGGNELDALLGQLKAEQEILAQLHGKYVPLAVKIAPDLDADQIKSIAALFIKHRINGVIRAKAWKVCRTATRQAV